jgi:hypothetical protein
MNVIAETYLMKVITETYLMKVITVTYLRPVYRVPNVASFSRLSILDCPFGFL